MKSEVFDVPNSLLVQRQRNKEGPPVTYIVWKPHCSVVLRTQKEVIKWVKWPVKTPTGDALREWLKGFDDETAVQTAIDRERVKAEGFGPEAHDGEEDPTANTKMIT